MLSELWLPSSGTIPAVGVSSLHGYLSICMISQRRGNTLGKKTDDSLDFVEFIKSVIEKKYPRAKRHLAGDLTMI